MKKKFLKILLWIIAAIAILFIIAVIGIYSYFRFCLIPKLNPVSEDGTADGGISISEIAKGLSDKQIIDNILHFDKESASEMLVVLDEIESENKEQEKKDDEKKSNPASAPEPNPAADGKTAYERIMNTATKDEISEGMAIISKVDISKVNQLRKEGKNDEIKAYIKSVLTSGEISAALKLYNKYKHLL